MGITLCGIYFKNLLTVESTSAEFPPFWRNGVSSNVLFPIESPTMCFCCRGMDGKEWVEPVKLGQMTVTFRLEG